MSNIKEEKKLEIKNEEESKIKYDNPKEEKKKSETHLRNYRPLPVFRNIDRLFDDMESKFMDFMKPSRFWDFKPFDLSLYNDDKFFRSPLANITDEGDHFSINAELPGLEKGDIEINIHNGTLEIKGEQKSELEEKDKGYIHREYGSSSYFRCFTLPETIDEDKIEATFDKGILKLILPKIKEEKKKIEVK